MSVLHDIIESDQSCNCYPCGIDVPADAELTLDGSSSPSGNTDRLRSNQARENMYCVIENMNVEGSQSFIKSTLLLQTHLLWQ